LAVDTVKVEVLVLPSANVTKNGLTLTVGPFVTAGETYAVRLTVPSKPFMLDKLMVDLSLLPRTMASAAGLADTLKSAGPGQTFVKV
jgi:hypothetical protein